MNLSSSTAFFEWSCDSVAAEYTDFGSLKGRVRCFAELLELVSVLPFALLAKAWRTLIRASGLALSASLLILTLGVSDGAREFFVARVSSLAKDAADWFLFPFALLTCISKLLLGALVHPALYFRF